MQNQLMREMTLSEIVDAIKKRESALRQSDTRAYTYDRALETWREILSGRLPRPMVPITYGTDPRH